MMALGRRGLLGAFLATPAIVRPASIMRVRPAGSDGFYDIVAVAPAEDGFKLSPGAWMTISVGDYRINNGVLYRCVDKGVTSHAIVPPDMAGFIKDLEREFSGLQLAV